MELKVNANLVEVLAEHKRKLTQGIMTAILTKSFKYIPVDSGQMLRGTRLIQLSEDRIALVSPGRYAKTQYEDPHYHLIEGGVYKSISKTNLVSMDAGEKKSLKELTGSLKFRSAYWMKYHKLRDAGKLTRSTPQWFHQGYEEVLKEGINRLDSSAIAAARAKIRKGSYYNPEVIPVKGGKV